MLTIFLQAAAPQQSMMPTMIMIGLMVVGFYFLMIRPQMKKQKQEKNFQDSLKPGAKVITTSGMHGTIFSINDDDSRESNYKNDCKNGLQSNFRFEEED